MNPIDPGTGRALSNEQLATLDYFYGPDYRFDHDGDPAFHAAVGEHQQGVPFPRTPADLDLGQLSALTERDGFAVYDPAAPGGFRELNPAERELLDREISRVPDGPASVSPADEAAGWVDDVERRTGDQAFPYLPGAEWGEAGYREPRSDEEAAARVAHLDAQREAAGPEQAPDLREATEVEDALVDAEIDAHYSALAHDDDPGPARRVRELAALDGLRPLPEHQELQAELDEQDHDQPRHPEPEGTETSEPEPELEDEELEP